MIIGHNVDDNDDEVDDGDDDADLRVIYAS